MVTSIRMPGHGMLFQSPIFERLRSLNPRDFTADNLNALHRHVYDESQREFTNVRMLPLSEIEPIFLRKPAFIAKFQEISGVSPTGINFDTYQSFCVYERREGIVHWLQFYNIDSMQRLRSKDPAGKVFLHEITGTIPFKTILDETKTLNRDPNVELANINRESVEMSYISEGCASYFSQDPFDTGFTLDIELYAALRLKGEVPASEKLESLIGNRHFFGMLALTKIELAHGTLALVDLLRKIPAPVNDPAGEPSYAYALWKRYKTASAVMASRQQIPNFLVLPFEAFGFDIKDGMSLVNNK